MPFIWRRMPRKTRPLCPPPPPTGHSRKAVPFDPYNIYIYIYIYFTLSSSYFFTTSASSSFRVYLYCGLLLQSYLLSTIYTHSLSIFSFWLYGYPLGRTISKPFSAPLSCYLPFGEKRPRRRVRVCHFFFFPFFLFFLPTLNNMNVVNTQIDFSAVALSQSRTRMAVFMTSTRTLNSCHGPKYRQFCTAHMKYLLQENSKKAFFGVATRSKITLNFFQIFSPIHDPFKNKNRQKYRTQKTTRT